MIERPPGDDSSDSSGSGDSDDASDAPGSSPGGVDAYAMYTKQKEKFLTKLGRDIDFDPWDPNPYIPPRPGKFKKYGWDENDQKVGSVQEARDLMSKTSDEDIAARGQTMGDSEREENLNVIRRLRQNDVPSLRRAGDEFASVEAAADANAREKQDPWFDLNDRLGDAIKYDTEDADKLRALIAKVGGPPPQLVKFADNPRGYVLRTEILGSAISNARLERIIERREAWEGAAAREEQRKESVRKQMSKLDNPMKQESDLAEIAEIKRQREEEFMQNFLSAEKVGDYAEQMKEDQKEYEKKREVEPHNGSGPVEAHPAHRHLDGGCGVP